LLINVNIFFRQFVNFVLNIFCSSRKFEIAVCAAAVRITQNTINSYYQIKLENS